LKEEEAVNETALKDAKQSKSVIKDLLTECCKASPVNYNEKATLLESLAGASKVAKECTDIKSQKDKRGCLCLEAVIGDINQYLKLRCGKYERVLEHVIETVINCKHNPFYGGSFNGNDCFRLLHNNDLLFDALIEAGDSNSEQNEVVKKALDDVVVRHKQIFKLFGQVVPNFRSTRLLDETQREELLEAINEFWEAYIGLSKGSITTKIHFLVHHTELMLKLYGTIGFFAEDSMESIHAIVNALANQFAALDKSRRCTQVLRVLASRKMSSMDIAVEKQEKYGDSVNLKKRKRVQGQNKKLATETAAAAAVDQKLENAIEVFMRACGTHDACKSIESDRRVNDISNSPAVVLDDDCGKELTFPTFTLVPCHNCLDYLDSDVTVPDVLVPLHEVLVHGDLGDKA